MNVICILFVLLFMVYYAEVGAIYIRIFSAENIKFPKYSHCSQMAPCFCCSKKHHHHRRPYYGRPGRPPFPVGQDYDVSNIGYGYPQPGYPLSGYPLPGSRPPNAGPGISIINPPNGLPGIVINPRSSFGSAPTGRLNGQHRRRKHRIY